MLVPKHPTSDEKRFVAAIKRIAFDLNVPVQEQPVGGPYPYDFPVLLYQGRHLWATVFSSVPYDEIRRAVEKHRVCYSYYQRLQENVLARSVAVVSPPLAAIMERRHPESVSSRIVPVDAVRSTDEGYELIDYGYPYSPYLEEELKRIGGGVVDFRSLKPYVRQVYIDNVRREDDG